ncbi:YgdI/YgdR family lipoprotein [Dyella sp. RRB7]|uniref:YgdI/YgdR family lipoprotein n=1 Tax=Dyella sp. RRB7 TaxID=2919502 RepID=UPI001FA995CA|nr:YgdI/YgdR family lipoprotein [Dyella sp. RRB7]
MNRSLILTCLMGSCMALAGCGSSTRVVQNNDTCGKQMTDLQNALASGAMTRPEYDKARRVAIERCDSRDNH